jgi:hypothetical protein
MRICFAHRPSIEHEKKKLANQRHMWFEHSHSNASLLFARKNALVSTECAGSAGTFSTAPVVYPLAGSTRKAH